MSEPIAETVAKIHASGLCPADRMEGCSKELVAGLEQGIRRKLPAAYAQFLMALGKRAGGFLEGSTFAFRDVTIINEQARVLADESGVAMPDLAFAFFMHQGYQFLYFLLDEGDDPLVHHYMEMEPAPTSTGLTFSAWFAGAVSDEIRLDAET